MSLKVKGKLKTSTIIWGVIGIILGACLLRVYIWEQHYYAEKEGSERAVAPEVNNAILDTSAVEEIEVTDEDTLNHVVAADKPRYMSIPKLGIKKARIMEIGVNAQGELGTPPNIFDVGWYRNSGAPGTGGTAIYDGHNGGPTKEGVFKRIPELTEGDIITIERGDGEIFNYKVVNNSTIPVSKANDRMNWVFRSPSPGQESLSIITCTGEWSQAQLSYLSRQFLRAILVKV